jgi:type I restriction enzyme M protein
MPENPGIPLLFRDIFKNVYLPYRDPETLRAFLKIIDEFNYDHSEKLGDAFEYLLSVLGSQGDAGQFRTPRHIIDFMVDVIDPKKTETVLDPACGTAGFLISSYKHILAANTDAKGSSTLTPDEKGRLAGNFKGYDISPDMVRLSLVNLYLHGFADPHVVEYDTLTSEERWNEYADVILANPPFMSPKGGIKPHRKFSIQAKRSEVLFVDYMAEHLTPAGRAGIIVPEGIIFQSQGAYKDLRRMLVENSLVAVVSLPAGCFNPYSGVKTSILILDKSVARLSDTVGFFKVENDGFGLGAQRRVCEGSDLPKVKVELGAYLQALRERRPVEGIELSCGLIVKKERIAEKGEYGLSGERYRVGRDMVQRFPQVELGTICKPEYGFTASAADHGDARFVRITDIAPDGRIRKDEPKFIKLTHESEAYLLRKGDLLVARTGATFGKTMLFDEEYPSVFASYLIRLRFSQESLLPEFYWSFAQSEKYWEQARSLVTGGGQPQFNGNALTQIKIPLPPLEIQKEIVAEIEGYQKVITGARAVVENYRPYIAIDPGWPRLPLGTLAQNLDSRRIPITQGDRKEGPFPYYGASGIVDHVAEFIFDEEILLISEDGANLIARSTPIAFSVTGKCWVNNHAHVLKFENSATQKFVEVFLNSISIAEFVTGAAQPKLNQQALNGIPVPLPSLATQQSIVAEIESEQRLVSANRELIARFEKKIQTTLARVWGEDPKTASVDLGATKAAREEAPMVADA